MKKLNFGWPKETDLDKVKEDRQSFLYMDVEQDDIIPFFVKHPIFESTYYPYVNEIAKSC